MPYLSWSHVEDIQRPVLVKSADTGILFGGMLDYREIEARRGVYLIIEESFTLKTFGPLHTDDRVFDAKTMKSIELSPF
jgi:hypothetical protein